MRGGVRAALVEMLGEEDNEQPIDPHERSLLVNILKLHSLVASDIMVPRVDIMALDIETPFAEAAKQMIEVGHSRVPVFHETLDDIVGMIHIKDLLPFAVDGRAVPLAEIARKPLFVAPTMPLLDLLLQMRLSRMHLAIVVDEFGGTDGLVTIEDVIEEIVGEIEDEHDDADRPKLVARPDGTLLAPGRAPVEALAPLYRRRARARGFRGRRHDARRSRRRPGRTGSGARRYREASARLRIRSARRRSAPGQAAARARSRQETG